MILALSVMYLGRIVEMGPTAAVSQNPSHPYTRALLDSIPHLVTDSDELVHFKAIDGELPSPLAPPPGCHFHLRCPHTAPICTTQKPELNSKSSSTERQAACFYPLDSHTKCNFP